MSIFPFMKSPSRKPWWFTVIFIELVVLHLQTSDLSRPQTAVGFWSFVGHFFNYCMNLVDVYIIAITIDGFSSGENINIRIIFSFILVYIIFIWHLLIGPSYLVDIFNFISYNLSSIWSGVYVIMSGDNVLIQMIEIAFYHGYSVLWLAYILHLHIGWSFSLPRWRIHHTSNSM